MTVSKQLIDDIKWLQKSIEKISVYDLNVYSVIELYYNIAKKLNEVIKELARFEGVLSEEIILQNEKLTYLLGEGLRIEVAKKMQEMILDGVFDTIINQTIFKSLNDKVDDVKNKIESVDTLITGLTDISVSPTFDNSPIIQSFIDKLKVGEKLTLPKGTYFCNTTLDMSKLPKGCKINFQGNLKFKDNIDGIILNSEYSEIFFQSIRTGYTSYKNIPVHFNTIGIKCISLVNTNVVIKEIVGFVHGVDFVGDGTEDIPNKPNYRYKGAIYNEFKIDYINAKVGFYVTKNYGYVNENVMFLKWLDCYDGIYFHENDTWYDPFNNNKLIYIGLENIEHDGITFNNCRNNLIQTIRFENVGNKAIIEDKRSSGNVYINNYPIQSSKLDLQGLRRVFIGNQGAEDYEPISQIELVNWSGVPVHINRGYHKDLKNDTVYFDYDETTKKTFNEIFCKVKKSDGTVGTVSFDDITSDGTLQVTNTNKTLNRKVKIVRASASTSNVELTASVDMQQGGFSFYLVVKYKDQNISMKKASGSVAIASIPTVGVYQIMYIAETWKALKISDDVDSWYF